MRVWHNHDVAGRIRVAIQDDVVLQAAQDNKRFLVPFRRRGVTKDAAGGFPGFGNVAVAPGRPDVIHKGWWPLIADNSSALWRGGRGACARGGWRTAIDVILQLLTGLEERDALGRHFYLSPSFRIASRAAAALARAKAAEAANLDAVSALQRANDAFENSFDNGLGFFASKFCDADNLFHEVILSHGGIVHRCMLRRVLNCTRRCLGVLRQIGAPLARRQHFPWRAASGGISISPNEREGK